MEISSKNNWYIVVNNQKFTRSMRISNSLQVQVDTCSNLKVPLSLNAYFSSIFAVFKNQIFAHFLRIYEDLETKESFMNCESLKFLLALNC